MAAVAGIILIVLFWRFLVLMASYVFEAAGLPTRAAVFQARSALTGSGYTTTESEAIVHDPSARKAASALFIIGFVGPVTLLGLFGFGFLIPTAGDVEIRATVLVGSLVLIVLLDRIGLIRKFGRRPARWAAGKWFGMPIGETWTVFGDHAVTTIDVGARSTLGDGTVGDLCSANAAVVVLGIRRFADGALQHLSQPSGTEAILPGDHLLLFGSVDDMRNLELRAAGA